jgi:hypothetical protein
MLAPTFVTTLADATSAASAMRSFVTPVIDSLCAAATLVCVFFLTSAGYQYMTSAGKVERLEHAKHVMKSALIGLSVVLGAAVLTTILTHAYAGSSQAINAKLPNLTAIQPAPVSNGLLDILIKAITGLLNNIIQSIAAPFLKALTFFTTSTPLMAENSAVFNLWLVLVGMTDVTFVLVVALLGFHIMGASTFGFDEVEFKHLLPRLGLIFLLINSSIFAIDGVIELSNAMIHAINAAGGSTASVWDVLTTVVKQSGGEGVAALLIMVAFLIFAIILLVYYVGRLVTLYLGAVLSPLVLLLWLVPGFRDFSESAAKVYVTTVFVLLVHVVILELAASLFAGLVAGSPTQTPDTLMAMVVGLATLIALLKTQGVMMQLSYVSVGPRSARKLSGQFLTGVSYLGGKGKAVASTVSTRKDSQNNVSSQKGGGTKRPNQVNAGYTQPKSKSRTQAAYKGADTKAGNTAQTSSRQKAVKAVKTGETTPAPKPITSKNKEENP